jgi:hypothetical protein
MVGFIVNPLGMLNLEARFCRGSKKQVQSHKHLFSVTQVPSGHHQLFKVLGPLTYACQATCYFDRHKTYYERRRVAISDRDFREIWVLLR